MIRLLACIAVTWVGVAQSDSGGQKIKHVVVLMEENRPFDHIFGWLGEKVDGLSGKEFNLVDPHDETSAKVFVDDKCPYINECDPGEL